MPAYGSTLKQYEGKILDEFTKVVGCHRKAAIRLLHRGNRPSAKKKRGHPRQYGIAIAEALRAVWEVTDRLCSKRLHLGGTPIPWSIIRSACNFERKNTR